MFVMNCSVLTGEVLRYDKASTEKKKNKRKRRGSAASDCAQEANPASDDVYHPVVCTVCKSEVGVYDTDEVYHFFNVLASYS